MVAEVEELLETSDEELLFELEDSQQYRRVSTCCRGCRRQPRVPQGALLKSQNNSERLLLTCLWFQGCYGCGALLQSEDDGALGYLEDDLYQAKAAHRQLGQVLCRYSPS